MSLISEPHVEPLSTDECLTLISTVSIGRVGTTTDALPVTFALRDGSIVFRTMPGTTMRDLTLNAVVALQADHYASLHDPSVWSVMVQGMTQQITDPTRLATARLLPPGSWAPDGRYLALQPAIITGRRIIWRVSQSYRPASITNASVPALCELPRAALEGTVRAVRMPVPSARPPVGPVGLYRVVATPDDFSPPWIRAQRWRGSRR